MAKNTPHFKIWYKESRRVFDPNKVKIILGVYFLPYALIYLGFRIFFDSEASFIASNFTFIIWFALYYINRKDFRLSKLPIYIFKSETFSLVKLFNLLALSALYSLLFYAVTQIYSVTPTPDLEKNVLFYLIYLSPITFILSLYVYQFCLSLFLFSFIDATSKDASVSRAITNSLKKISQNFLDFTRLILITFKWPILLSALIHLAITLSLLATDQATALKVFTTPINEFDPFNTLGSVDIIGQFDLNAEQFDDIRSVAFSVIGLMAFALGMSFISFFLFQFAFCKYVIAHHFAFKTITKEQPLAPTKEKVKLKKMNLNSNVWAPLFLNSPFALLQLKALPKIEDKKHADRLMSLVHSNNNQIRKAALNTLVKMNNTEAKQYLLSLWPSSENETKLIILDALCKYKHEPEVRKQLAMIAFKEKDMTIKQAAKQALTPTS